MVSFYMCRIMTITVERFIFFSFIEKDIICRPAHVILQFDDEFNITNS